ncbi:MAG: DUF2723 domain-containing protein [Bacteroidetes bacterium]|jgi:hypothetical protein|nr:DUF2723 domain-containing protein [Bacteroidota bacterium]MBT4398715.1 DUF2723 domain-containing protein [Bacteroidota bacterium]MBT4408538.1 DUF2723 domain-containing protein [Bacteroidota bacterium]MBT5426680.1 DUF2723 domain-containing protein [Bacteroidota bacterium]MBT7093203.1 DUF2723 domain-containing protein [Bacteroidota bacterium]
MDFKKVNIITGWIVFAIASLVYLLTIEPTTSFWDCGEFIATAFHLEVGHPPGAPLFMMLGQFFALFAFGNLEAVPVTMNVLSALASGFTILFLFWSVTHLARKLFSDKKELSLAENLIVIGAGLVGALSYTFTDSFWFSAVEAEVYSLSALFTAVVFWAILKWENVANEPYSNRWLILIAFLMGLSVGVHILNLLALPAMVLVYYFKKYTFSIKGFLLAIGASFLLIIIMLSGVIQLTIKLAMGFELFFTNTVGLPYHFGAMIFILLLIAGLTFGIWRTQKKGNVLWNTILLGITIVMIGYSSILIIPIRSQADPPLDENNPDNTISLLSYVNREVYGQRPLFHGEYYNAPIEDYKDGKKIYYQKDGKYEVADTRTEYVYDDRFTTFFPRMYNNLEQRYIDAYQRWGKVKGTPIQVQVPGEDPQYLNKPTFTENMRFFFRYQLGHMYLRYFMWNFSGRQNDAQGHGDIMSGNWITGVNFIDAARLGSQDNLPASTTENKANNKYYGIPLLLGLLGAWFYYKRERKGFWVVTLLFFMTGIAIIVYMNEVPVTPRERDYIYVGSFYAFAMFIGISVVYIYELLSKYLKGPSGAITATVIGLILVPGVLATQNWDDHDRSNRYVAHDFAYNYLAGLDENAVVFTNGDNDTFPLWYMQEVENFRTDVRVACMPFMPQEWYIEQMKRKYYTSEALPISMEYEQFRQGKRGYIPIQKRVEQANLKELIEFVANEDKGTQLSSSTGRFFHYLPTDTFILPVDSAKVINNGTVTSDKADQIVDQITWKINPSGRTAIYKDELIVLDLLAHNEWDRPIYYTTPGQSGSVRLDEYLELHGLTYRLVPIKGERQSSTRGRVNTERSYDNLMNKFRYTNFGDESIYFDETCRRMMTNLRNNFNRLAMALIEENKMDKAQAVLAKMEEVIPTAVIGYSFLDVNSAEAWLKAGNKERGLAMMKVAFDGVQDNMNYYLSLGEKYIPSVNQQIQNALAYELRELLRIAEEAGETELQEEIQAKSDQYYSTYLQMIGQAKP